MNIVFIGAGNVATQFAKAFSEKGHRIIQVFSRTEASAKQLADTVKTSHTTSLLALNTTADAYFLCVKDDALLDVISQLPELKGLILHTSGATSIDVLNRFEDYGVFYPLQTLQKQVSLDLSKTPVCIEANSEKAFDLTKSLATAISGQVHAVNTQQRLALHVAAVFANNFTHYLFTQAASILEKEQLPLHLIQSIITETFKKLDFTGNVDWKSLQTGPAKRGDEVTLQKHAEYLAQNQQQLAALYKTLSESIIKSK